MPRILIAVLLAGTLAWCSCQTAPEAYLVDNFSQRDIRSIAVMPVRDSTGNEALNRAINRSLQRAFQDYQTGYEVFDYEQSAAIIQKNNLTKDYSDFLEQYRTTGVANTQLLRLIGAYLKADAVMLGLVNRYEQGYVSGGNIFSQYSPAAKLSATLSMLEVFSGQVVWEVNKTVMAEGSFNAPSYQDVAADWAYQAVRTIPSRPAATDGGGTDGRK